ncbi:hypothetical protein C5E16_02110 [Clavibacter michiganensis]|uniref:Uncharacterized protein n=1 Tax=Clavibacter michiganensis TaxID=28447 RepID=A0A2S5VXM0_9MICO|nr:hypothetical protein [Clavibacter michiganensis]PPF71062.1 hypothetical protein C5E16_02110 [Clavibacter michiganensis]
MHDEDTTWTRRMIAGLTTGIALVGAGALGSTVYLTQAVLADDAGAPTTSAVVPADPSTDDEAATSTSTDPSTGSGGGSTGSGSTGSGSTGSGSTGSDTSTGSGTTDSGVSAGTGSGSSARTSGS